MLRQAYIKQQNIGGRNWNNLENIFSAVKVDESAFLSMNWDTVIEEGLYRAQGISSFDYGCDAYPAKFSSSDISIRTAPRRQFQILKPHGSVNWLYCDNCRRLFWFAPDQTNRIASHLFKPRDWSVIQRMTGKRYSGSPSSRLCPECQSDSLGTRFATFSYRKALDFPMHVKSWLTAEQLLRKAKTWTFIGYSLPGADYEFKLLLKRVQLSRNTEPLLCLITGGNKATQTQTLENYTRFFGPKFVAGRTFFPAGLNSVALKGLASLDILHDN